MNLSKFTDYSFRILIYLGNNRDTTFTIHELSSTFDISLHHVKKIVCKLSKNNYIDSSKGRNGGIKLGMHPKDINLGKVFELTEENLNIVECFGLDNNYCTISNYCKLKPVLKEALDNFKASLNSFTLEDILN